MNLKYEIKSPAWLPPVMRDMLADAHKFVYTTKFTRAERKVYRRKKYILPSVWAEKNRELTLTSLPGAWKNSVAPYLVGIMDGSDYHSVREAVICAAPQTGKSEAVHNVIGKKIDREPGPVMYCYPDEKTTIENSRDRVLPMIKNSVRLRSYLTGTQNDEASYRIKLQHMPIYFSWASSPARLANKPIRYIIADEIDKYPTTAGKNEASPLDLLDKRLTTYRRQSKYFKMSTPTIEAGPIWMELQSCAGIFEYWVRCPKCGEKQLMTFGRIKWPANERNPETVKEKFLAWYECQECNAAWNDATRNAAVANGEWCAKDEPSVSLQLYLETKLPRKIGFHLPAWVSPFISLSECAAAFLETIKPDGSTDKNKLKNFRNNIEALPWKDYQVDRPEELIYQLCDDRPEGLVPGGVSISNLISGLTAGVDTQDNGLWYCIRAWSTGLLQASWAIRLGFVTSFEALVEVLFNHVYQDSTGNTYPVQFTLIDSQGHRTREVYDFCRAYRGRIIPTKGERRMNVPYSYTDLDTYPGTNLKIPGGLKLLRFNTTYYKNDLSSKLEVNPADPGAFKYFQNLREKRPDWAPQMCAEYVDENGVWQCPDGKPNHGWDCEVLNLVAADVIGMKYWGDNNGPKPGRSAKNNRSASINPFTGGKRLFG